MKRNLILLASAVLLLTSCEKARQAKESYNNISKLSAAGEKMTATLDEAKVQREEREKRGDTLAMPYKQLEQYLPAEVSGYTAEAPTGMSQKTAGMSISTAEREYRQGAETVKVSVIDYNGAHDLYQGAAAIFALGMEREDDEQIMGPANLDVKGVQGMSTFYKKDGRAEMSVAAGGRFLITLNATKQKDMELLKSVAKSMDLEKLAEL